MRICVQGLWHLGSVTAACLADAEHEVTGLDADAATIAGLSAGSAPVAEPGLDALLQKGIASGRLRFTTDPSQALVSADLLWVCFDTPVDEDDHADVGFVESQVRAVLPHLRDGATVLVSSQLPAGSVRRLEAFAREALPGKILAFACSPENLRLGKAIDVFTRPDRIVVGVRNDQARAVIAQMLAPITDRIEWMSVESAEMTKHAINAFLALSVTFANEIATLCEQMGADAKEVERGLKSENRIGPKAYLSPGGAFAGGTLARDVAFLCQMPAVDGFSPQLLPAVKRSNDAHKQWVPRKLKEQLGALAGRCIALWGLTYKPGTDTLRRSLAVELCEWLLREGARVRVFDPAVRALPSHWGPAATLCASALDATTDADALVVGTEWPAFREAAAGLAEQCLAAPRPLLVVDPNRHIDLPLRTAPVRYFAVGTPAAAKG